LIQGLNLIPGNETTTKKAKVQKQILKNLSGEIKKGEMTAIMGASGSGKTTLINFLTSRSTRGSTLFYDGELLVNGFPVGDLTPLKNIIGFVPQEDTVVREASIKENFEMYGKYRQVKHLEKRVNENIKALDLEHCQDTIVGDEFQRGISGGELKRTSIGIELMSHPEILFLDEPTTGLDAKTALDIVTHLRKLCQTRGMGIVAVIHQPRPEILSLFDQVLVLSDGNLIFDGTLKEIETKLTDQGYQLTQFETSVDFLMKLIDIHQIKTNLAKHFDLHEAEIELLAHLVLKERIEALTLAEERHNMSKRSTIISQSIDKKRSIPFKEESVKSELLRNFSETRSTRIEDALDPELLNKFSKSKNQKHSMFVQFWILIVYYIKFFVRKRTNLYLMVAQQMVTLVLIYFIFRNLGDPTDDTIVALQNRFGLFAVMSMYGFFSGFWSDVIVFVAKRKLFHRDQEGRYYDELPYFMANQFYTFPFYTILMFVVSTFFFFMFPLNFDPDLISNWFYFFYFVYVGGFVSGASLGSVIAVLSDRVQEITAIMAFIIPPLTIATGYYCNIKSSTIFIQIFAYTSPSRFSYQGLLINEFMNHKKYTDTCMTYVDCDTNPSGRCRVPLDDDHKSSCDPIQVMDFYQMSRWSNLVYLLVLCVFYRFLGYLIFKLRNRPKLPKYKKLSVKNNSSVGIN
jgi:ABC-type multidrug transport system ATPase subunit